MRGKLLMEIGRGAAFKTLEMVISCSSLFACSSRDASTVTRQTTTKASSESSSIFPAILSSLLCHFRGHLDAAQLP